MTLRLGRNGSAAVVVPVQLERPPLEWNERHPGGQPQQGTEATGLVPSAAKRCLWVTQTGAEAQILATVAGPQQD